jgi:hypothetical protein
LNKTKKEEHPGNIIILQLYYVISSENLDFRAEREKRDRLEREDKKKVLREQKEREKEEEKRKKEESELRSYNSLMSSENMSKYDDGNDSDEFM